MGAVAGWRTLSFALGYCSRSVSRGRSAGCVGCAFDALHMMANFYFGHATGN